MPEAVLVDTSALFALLDEDDANHVAAAGWIADHARDPELVLVSHSYVTVETLALTHARLGTNAVRALIDGWFPALSLLYVDQQLHRAALTAYRAALSRRNSFVDHVSFEMMRWRHVDRAFTFDQDFARAGFQAVPPA